ncbi:DUF1642 domain-containing protein [Enterococcus hirae]|uniref:DUF1642 domain-containing protein n=1 Tax=Enterococcus hirae TaxID=1354 RepID=UPI0039A63D36
MNKQEGIKELESLKMKSEDIRSDCYNNGINAGITVMKKLDEPQKPVIDSFVAEYLNYCMANEWTLREAFLTGKFQLPEYLHEAVDWLEDSMNQNIFAQAWLFGYEIKKEPLYRVKLGEGYFVEYHGRGALIMIIPDDNKEIKIFDSKSDAERTAQTIGGTVEEVAEG